MNLPALFGLALYVGVWSLAFHTCGILNAETFLGIVAGTTFRLWRRSSK